MTNDDFKYAERAQYHDHANDTSQVKNLLEYKARQVIWLRRCFLEKVFGETDDGKKRHFTSLAQEQAKSHYFSVFELVFLLLPTSLELSKFAYEILLMKELRFESACLDDLVVKL